VITPGPRFTPKGYQELAAILRTKIRDNDFDPHTRRLPSEPALMQTYGLGRTTVRRATRMLQHEGLVDNAEGWGLVVRDTQDMEQIRRPGASVSARMPDPDERDRFGLGLGTPLLVVRWRDNDGEHTELLPADRFEIVTE
jgi:DNA-binding GntR family transcriptional regulator